MYLRVEVNQINLENYSHFNYISNCKYFLCLEYIFTKIQNIISFSNTFPYTNTEITSKYHVQQSLFYVINVKSKSFSNNNIERPVHLLVKCFLKIKMLNGRKLDLRKNTFSLIIIKTSIYFFLFSP